MKKISVFCFLILFFFFVIALGAQAENDFPMRAELCNIINWLRNVVLLFLILMIILNGYKMITGGGDPKQAEDAKRGILFALVGGIVVYLAASIIKIALPQFSGC